jgi:hypothetical protein
MSLEKTLGFSVLWRKSFMPDYLYCNKPAIFGAASLENR